MNTFFVFSIYFKKLVIPENMTKVMQLSSFRLGIEQKVKNQSVSSLIN